LPFFVDGKEQIEMGEKRKKGGKRRAKLRNDSPQIGAEDEAVSNGGGDNNRSSEIDT
jgi:hypothetical protein